MITVDVINGPNLNMVGTRQPHIYGEIDFCEIKEMTTKHAQSFDVQLIWKESNSEGKIVDFIHESINSNAYGLIINPGAYAHSSLAIADALAIFSGVKVEVHLTNLFAREIVRQNAITAKNVDIFIAGAKQFSYILAIDALMRKGEKDVSDNGL